MYILLFVILTMWVYAVYTFARWRYDSTSRKGVYLVNVLNDRPTNIFLRVTAGIALAIVIYIIQ